MDSLPWEKRKAMLQKRDYKSVIAALRWDCKAGYLADPTSTVFRGICSALLRAGLLADAIEHYKKLIDITESYMRGGSDYGELSAAYWLLAHREQGDYEPAVANLRRALKCNYGDGAKNMSPALLLYYMAVRTKDAVLKQESIDQIQGKLATGWSKNWPAPLGRYLVGVAGEDHVEEELANEHPIRQPDERSRYDFYRGVKLLEAGEEARAKACFRLSVDQLEQTTLTTEFVLARDELRETPMVSSNAH